MPQDSRRRAGLSAEIKGYEVFRADSGGGRPRSSPSNHPRGAEGGSQPEISAMTAKLAVSHFFTAGTSGQDLQELVPGLIENPSTIKENERRWGIPLLRAGS